MTFTAPATASEKAEHERLLSMAKQQGSPVGSKKGRSAATSPTDARSPEGETEAEKRKRMKRAVRRMSNAVVRRYHLMEVYGR